MNPGLGGLLKEARLVGELLAFAGDTLRKPPARAATTKPVMLIPGLMAGDTTLYPIAGRLRLAGYQVFFSGIWFNTDCPVKTMSRLERSLREASGSAGARVIVIGHSLGGIYARELARRFPLLVERAILLGSPLKDPLANSNHLLRVLAGILRLANRQCLVALGESCQACGLDLPGKAPKVPETIVYTKSDGVVNWRSCLESGSNVETVEVDSSHCGLSVSNEVWDLIIDRLEPHPARASSTHIRSTSDGRYRLLRFHPPAGTTTADPGLGVLKHPPVSRVEIADRLRCRVCGSDFAANPAGDRTLVLNPGGARRRFFFCGPCGDSISSRIQSNDARKRYLWYWAVPMKDERASDGAA
jgi:hypothetical protein